MEEIYDIAILGAGPAGISAAIYATRGRMKTIWLDSQFVQGGQILNTYEVDNYPGLPGISGMDLGETMGAHAQKLGITPVREKVLSVEIVSKGVNADENENTSMSENVGIDAYTGYYKIICTKKHEYRARAVVLACGARHRTLGIPGEEELSGMGVSYCATCDGAFFKDRTVVVAGGGNMAVEDALFLPRVCKKVYLVHRREELRADKILQESLLRCENVEIIWNSVPTEIQGTEHVTGLKIRNVKNGQESVLETDGVFIAIGMSPNTEIFKDIVALDEKGYIIAGEEGITQTPGIFAAGDIRTKALRQVVTAVSDGANASVSAQRYLNRIR